jgi:hypothetical protein
MGITKVDIKLLKLHESLERMWTIFYGECKRGSALTDFLQEKERCHQIMSEISEEVNQGAKGIEQRA